MAWVLEGLKEKERQYEVTVPGDKSIAHRAIMLASLAQGNTHITGIPDGADVFTTINVFRQLGIDIKQTDDELYIEGSIGEPNRPLDMGNSGTTARLTMGILAGTEGYFVLTGDESLRERPMKRVIDPLRLMGADIDGRANGALLPVGIRGRRLRGIEYEMPKASAQVKSALLLAGLQAEGTTIVHEKLKSRDHTERLLASFGVKLDVSGSSIAIKGSQVLKSPGKLEIPGDFSSAAFWIAVALTVPRSTIEIKNVGLNPSRIGLLTILKRMGAKLEIREHGNIFGEPVGDLLVSYSKLKGTEVEKEIIPSLIDELPILAVISAQAEGKTEVLGAEELRVKETDRIKSICNNLGKLGVDIVEQKDGFIVTGGRGLIGNTVSADGDHRMAIALAVASLNANGITTIKGAEIASVSYPDFKLKLDDFAKVNRNI